MGNVNVELGSGIGETWVQDQTEWGPGSETLGSGIAQTQTQASDPATDAATLGANRFTFPGPGSLPCKVGPGLRPTSWGVPRRP